MMKRLVQIMTIALLCAVLAGADAAAETPRRIAIVVGANAAAPDRKPLRFAHRDAANVADVLALAGFESRDVHVLEDPDPDVLLGVLDRVLASEAGPSMLLFYYSGHADARAVYPNGKRLALSKLRARLDAADAVVRLGIIDACRGGGWTGTKGLSETEVFAVELPMGLSNEGSVLISSSSGVEDAHESEALRGSFFTHHWNAALRGAGDENLDGTITLVEAFGYASALTIRDTALHTQTPQHPSFQMNLRGSDDLPLVTMTRGTSLVELVQSSGPLQLVHLGSGVVVLELPAGERTMRLSVPPGHYLVRRQSGDRTHAREIEVVADKTTRVEEEKLALVGDSRLTVKGAERSNRGFVAVGIGAGGISGTDDEDFSQGMSWTIQAGYGLGPGVQLMLSGDYTAFTRYQPDPDLSQQQSSVTLGLRWAPFEAPLEGEVAMTDVANLHVKAGLGVGHLIRQPYGTLNPFETEQGKWGGAAMLGLGWSLFRGERFGFGIEASDSLVVYDDGARHNFGVNFLMRANLF